MPARNRRTAVPAPPPRLEGETLLDRLCWWCALAAIFILPVIVIPSAYDPYRTPKELILRAAGIVIAALFAIRCVLFGMPPVAWKRDRIYVFVIIVLAWTALTAAVARHRVLAGYSLLFAASAAAVFAAVYTYARTEERWLTAMHVILAAAAFNGVSCLAARMSAGTNMFFAVLQNRSVGLLGSANDAGPYLALTVVAAAAMAVAVPARRWLYAVVAAFLAAALVTTATMGALVALFVAAAVALFLVSRRNFAIAAAGLALAAAIVVVAYAPLRARVKDFAHAASTGDLDAVLGGRATPFLAAIDMAKDRPLTGVGPGCFAYEYFPYKIAVEERHPSLVFAATRMMNFGDVHNDHLQTLAQTGLPGYALFLAALVLVGRCSLGARPGVDEAGPRFAHAAAMPFATVIAVAALPEFIIELAAPAVTALALAALCLVWRDRVATA